MFFTDRTMVNHHFSPPFERKYLPLFPSILCNKQIQARFSLWGTAKTFLPDLCNCSILSSWHEVIGQLWLFEPGLVNHAAWGGAWSNFNAIAAYPIGSIYGVCMYIPTFGCFFMVNVGKYAIHGSCGYRRFKRPSDIHPRKLTWRFCRCFSFYKWIFRFHVSFQWSKDFKTPL